MNKFYVLLFFGSSVVTLFATIYNNLNYEFYGKRQGVGKAVETAKKRYMSEIESNQVKEK